MKRFIINDTTLRDGEQTAGIIFSRDEKILIAGLLDKIGVDEIEAGVPAMGGAEQEAIKKINSLGLKAKIISWNRANKNDIYESLSIGLKYMHVSIPISNIHIKYKLRKDIDYVKKSIIEICKILRKEGVIFSVGGEDSSRTDIKTLFELINIAEGEGAYKYRYSDTVGTLNPLTMHKNIETIRTKFKHILLEIHTHNDFGMATANSIAALTAGAHSISGSISGIGERAGNCPLEEVMAYFKFIEKMRTKFNLIKAKELAGIIANITKRPLPLSKPIFGNNIFYHEAGIHTDGVIKNPINYEAFPPEEVGLERKLLIGKHSGTSVIKHKLKNMDISITDTEARYILNIVRSKSTKLRRNLTDIELKNIYLSSIKSIKHSMPHL